jgi:hypothetical protein
VQVKGSSDSIIEDELFNDIKVDESSWTVRELLMVTLVLADMACARLTAYEIEDGVLNIELEKLSFVMTP